MKAIVLAAVLALTVSAVDAQQEALGKPWKRVIQTDETHTVYCNFCEALNDGAALTLASTLLKGTDSNCTGAAPTASCPTSSTPTGIILQSGVDYCPAITGEPGGCPIVSSVTKNCVKLRLKPACTSPTDCRDGNVYQIHVNATATSTDVLDCDLRVDVKDAAYSPN